MRTKPLVISFPALLGPLLLLLLTVPRIQAADSLPDRVQAVFQAVAKLDPGEPIWNAGQELAAEGDAVRPLLEQGAGSKDPAIALTAGYALLKLGEQRLGTSAMEKVILDATAPLARRIDAAAALGVEGGELAPVRIRALLETEALPDRIQVELAKGLWRLTRSPQSKERLRTLLKSASARTREEAALALAAFGPTEESKKLLSDLVFLPGEAGDRARQVLLRRARASMLEGDFVVIAPLLRQLADQPTLDFGTAQMLQDVSKGIDDEATADRFTIRLLSEIIALIRRNYVVDVSLDAKAAAAEEDRMSAAHMATAAAKSLAGTVDPYSTYLDEDDILDITSQIEGKYGGIGAWVGIRNGRFTILLPMHGEPAHEAGLRAMDWVEKIDGEVIKDLELKEIIKRLKGDPGTSVKLDVWRRDWHKAREFAVTRKEINIPSVKGVMLPDGIGYIRLERFGDQATPRELEQKLKEMEKAGMRALVLDLSDNPGGLLSTAVEVAQKFLPRGKLVVYTQTAKDGKIVREDYTSEERGRIRESNTLPLVVLINEGSASASEIVAGALQQHGRALLIGEKTYGKGSVQRIIHLSSTQRRTCLKITSMKWYLPDGHCINSEGIEPNIKVEFPTIAGLSIDARLKLRDTLELMDYIREQFAANEALFRRLLTFDNEDPSAYPAFDKLMAQIRARGVEIEPQDVRREIRRALIQYLESELGEEVVIDAQENVALQRAVTELRTRVGAQETIPLYDWYGKQITLRQERKIAEEEQRKLDWPPHAEAVRGKPAAGDTE